MKRGDLVSLTIKTNDIVTNFKAFADRAVKDKEIITVSRPKNENVVVISEKEFQEYARAKRNMEYIDMLRKSEKDYQAGRIVVKSMDELRALENSME